MSNPTIAIVAKFTEELGPMVANHQEYESLFKAIRSGEHAQDIVPSVLPRMIRHDSWMRRYDRIAGKPFLLDPHEFIRFIEEKPPIGLGTTLDNIRRYLGDGSEGRIAFEKAVDRGRGNPIGRPEAPRTPNGMFSSIPNIVRDTGDRDDAMSSTIPIRTSESEPKPNRDRSGEPRAGNSTGYAVRRLSRERPDLLGKVEAGEMSPHKAMVEAGLRQKTIAVPVGAETAARVLLKHFRDTELIALIRTLAKHAGLVVMRDGELLE